MKNIVTKCLLMGALAIGISSTVMAKENTFKATTDSICLADKRTKPTHIWYLKSDSAIGKSKLTKVIGFTVSAIDHNKELGIGNIWHAGLTGMLIRAQSSDNIRPLAKGIHISLNGSNTGLVGQMPTQWVVDYVIDLDPISLEGTVSYVETETELIGEMPPKINRMHQSVFLIACPKRVTDIISSK